MTPDSTCRRALLRAMLIAPLLGRAPRAVAQNAEKRVLDADPGNYRQLLAGLRPGDTLRLRAGEYPSGLPVHGLAGSADAPITIEGPRGGAAVFAGRAGRNTVSIIDSAHVHLRDLTLDGRDEAVDGVKAEGHARFAHHIVLERLKITGHGAEQSIVGIAAHCPAWGWQILDSTIIGAGTGMYLGRPDGSAPFWEGLIAGNRILNPIGYGIQIKHQRARPALEQAPAQTTGTVIRGNVIAKSESASEGERARPNLLLGHFPIEGAGSEDLYLVHGNLLFDNPGEALLQAEGRLRLYNNLLVNPRGSALLLLAQNDRPRDVAVFHNSIVASGAGIVLVPPQPGDRHTVLRNLVYAGQNRGALSDALNHLAPFAAATRDLMRPLTGLREIDMAPRGRAAVSKVPLPPELAALPGAADDYLGRRRAAGLIGACQAARAGGAACR